MDSLPDFSQMSIPEIMDFLKTGLAILAETNLWSKAANYGAFTLVFYDWIITLDQEIAFFWKKNPSLVTLFYFVMRYFSMLMLGSSAFLYTTVTPTETFCLNMYRFQAAGGIVIFTTTECLLTLRLQALYGGSKFILALMGTVLLCALAGMTTVVGLLFSNFHIITRILPGIAYEACIPTRVPSYWVWFWAAPLTFQTICFSLALYKGFQSFFSWSGGFGTRLVNVLMRDSFMYFLGIAAVESTTVIIWTRGPPTSTAATVGFALASCTVVSSRLLLNLRAAARGPEHRTTWGAPAGLGENTSATRYGSSIDREATDKYRHSVINIGPKQSYTTNTQSFMMTTLVESEREGWTEQPTSGEEFARNDP